MAFLYCTYIITYAITSPLLGKYIDNVSNRNNQNIHEAMQNVAGVQFTIIFILVMTATFVPRGAFAFNPKMLNEEDLDQEIEDEDEEFGAALEERMKAKQGMQETQRGE